MKTSVTRGGSLVAYLFGLMMFPYEFALGQEGSLALEEVIVTAQRRVENLQDVPVSVIALGGEHILDRGIGDLEELSPYVPNLTMQQTPGDTQIYMRGLGSGENQGFEQSVGLFIDGIYAGRGAQFAAPFLDVSAVEVLRGPQGTLFGKNTIAGAITVNSARPTNELEAIVRTRFDVEYGDYNVDAVLSGPLTDSLAGRVAVRQGAAYGYFDNTFQDRDEAEVDTSVLRGSLLWDITESVSAFLKYETSKNEVVGKAILTSEVGPWGSFIQEADPNLRLQDDYRSTSLDEYLETDSESFTLHIEADISGFELTSITGYSEFQHFTEADTDVTAVDAGAFRPYQDFEQWSQELRLASPIGESMDYILGVYYQKNELDAMRNLGVATANLVGGPNVPPLFGALPPLGFQGDFQQDAETYAVFGSLSWRPIEKIQVIFGLRYTREQKDADREVFFTDYLSSTPLDEAYDPAEMPAINTLSRLALETLGVYEHQIADEREVDDWSPSLRVSYDLADDVMLYVSASRAFKSGGFNEAGTRGDDVGEFPPNGEPANFEFEDEDALSVEFGGKMRLLDQRASLNFAVFRSEFDNLQVSAFQGDSFVVGNAANVLSQGVEVDGVVLLSEAWTLSGSMAYLDAEYENFANAPCTISQTSAFEADGGVMGGCQQDLSGQPLPYAPEWSGVMTVNFNESVGSLLFSAQADLVFTGQRYLAADLDAHTKEDAVTTINARMALSHPNKRWEVALVGKNLTDETIRTFSNDAFLLDGAFFSRLAPPRVVEAQVNFLW